MSGYRRAVHSLAGAYAMDALTGADLVRFERHLARCPACASQVREFGAATARLAAAQAAEPPSWLVPRVLDLVHDTSQLGRPGGDATRSPARVIGRPRARMLSMAAALAILIVAPALLTGVSALHAARELGTIRLQDYRIAQVIAAPDAVLMTASARRGGHVSIVLSRRDHALVLTSAGLPPLPTGWCYQIWLIGPGGDRRAGLLPPPDGTMTSPVIASHVHRGDWVGLTVEPSGGSSQPTTAAVLMVNLTT